MKSVQFAHGILLSVALVAASSVVPNASAQNPDTMMPEQSAAKAKQILQELINGLGGAGYSHVRETACSGRRAVFGHGGEQLGYIDFNDFRRYPDKARIEYIAKGHSINLLMDMIGITDRNFTHGFISTLYDGDHGWSFDRSGVNELPATSVTDFQEQWKRSPDYLLHVRLNEPGLAIRFGGNDTVDLHQVDWVEITDSQERKYRIAVDRSTHYLVRAVVSTVDREYNQINDDTTIYANYQLKDSVWTPMQLTREHNGRRTVQFFFDDCHFNPGFSPDLFNKDFLQRRGTELVSKRK